MATDNFAFDRYLFVRQKRMTIKEDISFFADESESDELFGIKARTILDTGGSGDHDRKLDRRLALAVGLDTLQNR